MIDTPIIRDERLGRFKSAQRLVDSIRELDRQIRLTEESGMTVDQAVMVMSVLDTTEPEIREVIASVITKLSGNVLDKDPDPTPDAPEPDPETPDTPDPEPEPETPAEPESNEETLDETPVESEVSETASAVDESSTPKPETPEGTEDVSEASEISTVVNSDDSRTIMVEGCIHPVTVTRDGDVFIDGEKQEVLYNTQGYAFLKLPGASRQVRVILHSLVMQAFRPTKGRRQIIHLNGNQMDCHLTNLAYRGEVPVECPNFDATDALEASVALVDTHFNVGEAVKLLSARKKRASYDLVRKVMNKEIFTEVSDRYFDAHLHVVQDMPKPQDDAVKTEETEETETTTPETTTKDTTEETETTTDTTATEAVHETVEEIKDRLNKRRSLIKDALAQCNNDLRKAYNLIRKEGHDEITIFMVFNVKNHEFGHGSDDDIMELIRYAKKMGLDIRYTLLKECDIDVVPERMLKKATRR